MLVWIFSLENKKRSKYVRWLHFSADFSFPDALDW
jgi:hypothetical protein